MTGFVRRTIRRGLLVGLALTILAMSGLLGSASGQVTSSGPSLQVLKSDTNRNGFGDGQTLLGTLIADNSRKFSDKAPVSLAVIDKIDTPTNEPTNLPETPTKVTVAAPTRPHVALLNSVFPAGAQPKGTDLSLGVAFTNSGGQAAQIFTVVNPIPAQTDFKLDSTSTVLGTTGMTAEVEFSNDNAATWTYAPVSGGGGALEGYDRSVTHVRWRFNGGLSQTFPDNAGSVAVTARIR
ncbi:MAG: hypothetical protein ND895_04355 [Pyrinomonadaceae bacterium]|nr:hypothetical protein [Pyrinomonadaceae bacterium]